MLTYDVRTNSTINVAEADHHCECHALFVYPFYIVRYPGDRIRDVRIDPADSKVNSEI